MTAAEESQRSTDGTARKPPARVDSSTRVNVAFPFSQFKIQEPTDHLLALAAIVAELADLVAVAVPGPQGEALRRRAHEVTAQIR